MKKIIAFFLSAVLCLGLFAGCQTTGENAGNTRTITDGAGRQVNVPEKVESIVCVGVGALRYTCYVGAADLVVGVEDYEVKPGMTRLYNYVNFDKFKDLPVIGTNGQPYTEEIINLSPEKLRRVDFEFLVPIGSDTDKVQQVLIQVAKANDMVLETPDCMAAVSGYTENGIKVVLRVWVENANYWPAFFAINEGVKEGFDACKIKFARPQLDIHVGNN